MTKKAPSRRMRCRLHGWNYSDPATLNLQHYLAYVGWGQGRASMGVVMISFCSEVAFRY